ncbi:hypothetical protein V7157_24710 [Neobacillus drentensis]|uniref:hypothetical protein n=1 Tax=Neobacillus drentensis TaxID=220684 RepID=UPI003002765F
MKHSSWRQNLAQGHANGIAKAFSLTPGQNKPVSGTLYKVIAGSLKSKENGDELKAFLRTKAIILPTLAIY